MPALTFTDADAAVLDLNDGADFKLLRIHDAGIPALRHDTVKTPSRDGATYVRTILEERFLIIELAVMGSSDADRHTQRRALITALNPKTGVGTLKYTPAGTLYAIDCLVERGVGFRNYRGPQKELATISFRCPDPTWYDPTINSDTIDNSGSGVSVPLVFASPGLSFADGVGTTVFNNAGDVDSYPDIVLVGPCTDPIFTNTTTGKKLQFVGLTVASGHGLAIDCAARTAVTTTGIPLVSTNVISTLSSDSEFWPLVPGNNSVTFAIASGDVTATLRHYTRLLGL